MWAGRSIGVGVSHCSSMVFPHGLRLCGFRGVCCMCTLLVCISVGRVSWNGDLRYSFGIPYGSVRTITVCCDFESPATCRICWCRRSVVHVLSLSVWKRARKHVRTHTHACAYAHLLSVYVFIRVGLWSLFIVYKGSC